MKTLLLCSVAALATAGCTISTELDPEGSPRYRQAMRGTGSNIARRPDAQEHLRAGVRILDSDEVERMKRTGGSFPDPKRGG